MERKVISISQKTTCVSKTTGRRVHTEMVIYKQPIGKNKKGKQIFDSQTRHEAIQ